MPLRDIRYALRSLKKSPGFVAVAVLALGLGLALSTTMFAVLDAVLNPPQRFRNPERLAYLRIWAGPREKLSREDLFRIVRADARSFDAIVPTTDARAPVEMGSTMADVLVRYAPPQWFDVTGWPMELGRPFSATDGDGVAVVSRWLWKRVHGWRRSLPGARLLIGDRSYAIVGVMRKEASPTTGPAVWLPLAPADQDRAVDWPLVRLRPGVTLERAGNELFALGTRLTAQFGSHKYAYGFGLWRLTSRQEEVRDIHKAMVGGALVVLLIACVNLAQLMLARGLAKQRELALRMALGAGRAAAVRVMLTEAAIIILCGVALGAMMTVWGADLLESRMPTEVSWVGIVQPQLSWRVFGLAALAATAAAAVFGLVPAVEVVSKVSLTDPLKDAAGTTTGRHRGRSGPLVVAEVGLALVLMMGGALLLRSVHQLRAQTYNFDTATLLSARITMASRDSAPPPDPEQVLLAARAVPGVRDAALESSGPTAGGAVSAELTQDSTRLAVMRECPIVSPSYLRVHGLPVLKGRDFEPGDAVGDGVAILSAVAAARLYPGQDPVGRMVKLGGPASRAPWLRIVGVARTPMLTRSSEEVAEPKLWVTRPIPRARVTTLLVRAAAPDPRVAWRLGHALQAVAATSSIEVSSFTEARDREIVSRVFLTKVFVGMGAVGLALAALGLYGVLAYAVTQRMREFAVRVALGAEERVLFRMVLRDGMVLLLAGTGVGAFGAMGAAFLLQAVLVEVYPIDAISLVAAEVVLIGVGLAAALAPARRAMRADPVEILRAT